MNYNDKIGILSTVLKLIPFISLIREYGFSVIVRSVLCL